MRHCVEEKEIKEKTWMRKNETVDSVRPSVRLSFRLTAGIYFFFIFIFLEFEHCEVEEMGSRKLQPDQRNKFAFTKFVCIPSTERTASWKFQASRSAFASVMKTSGK